MNNQELTCILCPNGCDLAVAVSYEGRVEAVTGSRCPKGIAYATQEVETPMRTITTSVLVHDGDCALCSVRIDKPIPKDRIREVVEAIHKICLCAPVQSGAVVLANLLGTGSNVIATSTVLKVGGL